MKIPRWWAEGLFLWAFDCNLSSFIILRHSWIYRVTWRSRWRNTAWNISYQAFQVDANELEQVLCGHNGADIDDSEEDSRAYRKISVGIYRENYEDRWETIGLGITDYYQ